MGRRLETMFAILALLWSGCPTDATHEFDFDGDGWDDEDDCEPDDPDVHPEADDPYGDGEDTDCDGLDGVDADRDGYPVEDTEHEEDPLAPVLWDCNDANAHIHPGAEDFVGDEIDNNCDGPDGLDQDGDGVASSVTGGEDCDDGDPAVYEDAPELDDCLDNDCDDEVDEGAAGADDDGDGFCEGVDLGEGLVCCDDGVEPGDCDDGDPSMELADADLDGYSTCGGDCDDGDACVHPGAEELCNLVDDDCDGALPEDEADADGDGDPACSDCEDGDAALESLDLDGDTWSTCDGDCNDAQPMINPEVTDLWGDEFDQNCDGIDGTDGDGDGWASIPSGGEDCDDTDPFLTQYDDDGDGLSTCEGDCDDGDATLNQDDVDQDTWTTCDGDCDDTEPYLHPGMAETCDGIDNDCDPFTDEATDDDGDGFAECEPGPAGGDCDDSDPTVYPVAPELCDMRDNDCDGDVDEDTDADLDGDGYFPCQGDCNDLDPAIYPGAMEACDGADSDCDGAIPGDEVDADGDGYMACGTPPFGGDCDDADPWRSPGAAELCDGVDNDCEGYLDQDCLTCTITVPTDVATIQGAVDVAQDGAVICVEPGTYDENLYIRNVDLALVGIAGPAFTVIDGEPGASVVYVQGDFLDHAVLDVAGLTVRNGDHWDAAGVYLYSYTEVELSDLIIEDTTSSGYGGALRCVSGPLAIERVIFRDNETTSSGGGAYVGDCEATIHQSAFVRNHADSGGGLYVGGGTLALTETTFFGNTADGWGAGLHVASAVDDTAFEDVVFAANESANAGGGLYATCENCTFTRVTFRGNSAASTGGGARFAEDGGEVIDALFVGNHAQSGGGAHAENGGPSFHNVLFAGNTAHEGGGLKAGYFDDLVLTNVAFAGNETTGAGGAAMISNMDGNVQLTQVSFVGNRSGHYGGAMYLHDVEATIVNCLLFDNEGTYGGGVYGYAGDHDIWFAYCDAYGNVPDDYAFVDEDDPTGQDGNVSIAPDLNDLTPLSPARWDLHLSGYSALIDAGAPWLSDPDGSPSDIGAYGGPNAEFWDLDRDGYPEWWQPGEYDDQTYPGQGWDCDDRDATVYPGSGC